MEHKMSFSARVKEELARHVDTARHCQIAETAAVVSMCGKVRIIGVGFIIKEHARSIIIRKL